MIAPKSNRSKLRFVPEEKDGGCSEEEVKFDIEREYPDEITVDRHRHKT